MATNRKQILSWAEQGFLQPENIAEALTTTGAEPGPKEWRLFLDRLALWFGVIFLIAGIIFFFAYNWQEMGRYTKFLLVEIPLFGAVLAAWKLGTNQISGKAALLAASGLTGALLALVGQTYQTGADPWQLFATWAILITPWVVIGRFSALLLLWILLANLSMLLYFQTFPRFFGLIGLLFSTENLIWSLFIFNTVVLFLWEFANWRQVAWLSERWAVRIVAVSSGGLISTLALWAVLDFRSDSGYSLICYLAWMAGAYVWYRKKLKDLFVLAGGILSVIIIVAAWLTKHLFESAPGLLIIGLIIIGLSAAGAYWLKAIGQEEGS